MCSILFVQAAMALIAGDPSVPATVWPSGREVVELQAKPFALRDVRLLDGPFRDAMLLTQRYLHDLESDRLLWHFRSSADLETPGETLGGWEDTELRGHTMGHYLSGCAMMFASTGDEALKAKADAIVAELARCQQSIGSGYLSAYPEEQIDRAIARERVWAPWYTLHKIYAGLIDMYIHCGNAQALEVAQGMGRWAKGRLDPLDREAMQGMLARTEQGGMNEVLANLYGVTGERQWLELAQRFNADAYNEPLLRHRDPLSGQHANSFIPNMVGAARQYELTGNRDARHIAEFFWHCVSQGRSYCTGGTSVDERWEGRPYHLSEQLRNKTQEICCTYNMLKLTRHLFAWEPRAEYADYYEQNLLNGILSTQDPETGMTGYFVTLAPGRWKYFGTPRDSFWCCTGTGMENHAKYGDSIYFHNDRTLWVNQFIASELNWTEKSVRIRQETRFPEVSATRLTVGAAAPVAFEMCLRVPYWAREGVTLEIDGVSQQVTAQPGSILSIERTWAEGDTVEMTMPMSLWLWPMPDDSNLAAVMYGPMVLAGQLGELDIPEDMIYTTENWFQFPEQYMADAPAIVTEDRDPKTWIEPVEDQPLTFRTTGVGRPNDMTLVPYHRLWHQNYAIYWRITDEAGWPALRTQVEAEQDARRRRVAQGAERTAMLRARTIDFVDVGRYSSENAHRIASEDSRTGEMGGRRWRNAGPGGWWEYRMEILPDVPISLFCTYSGGDGGRTFDILVDGTWIATQQLTSTEPDAFLDVQYAIPIKLTEGKHHVVVRFDGQGDSITGSVYDCRTLKPAVPPKDSI